MHFIFDIVSKFLTAVHADDLFTDDPPGLDKLAEVVSRTFNFLVLSAGVVFVALVLLASYKFAMAQGDPKGVDGAKKTLTHAVIGFIIVIGVYALLSIIAASLGMPEYATKPFSLINQLGGAIRNLSASIGITF